MAKVKSRPKRWQEAAAKAAAAWNDLQTALDDLDSLRQEYEEWQGNLPENLQQSALAEKLQTIVDLDIDSAKSSMDDLLGELEAVELPRGFGRD
jgi:hypothetical protein